jgi:hypothetical protein
MAAIRSQVQEWKRLDVVIKSKEKELKGIRKQRKIYMNAIQEYLETTNQPGVKCGDIAIYRVEKTKIRPGKKQEDKEDDGVSVLRTYGIDNPRDVMKEIIEAMKGEEITESKLVLETVDKYKKKQKKKRMQDSKA